MFAGITTTDFPTESPLIAPEDLIDELSAVLRQRERFEARAARLLSEVSETRAFERDGYSSSTAMLKHRMSLHPGDAQRLVRRANALPAMPLTTMAHEQGAISGAQVDVLIETRAIAPEQFGHAEGELVQLAMDTPPVTELKKRLDYWLMKAAPEELAADRNRIREASALNLRRDGELMRINGWTDLESGERLVSRLDPGPPTAGDTRSAAARRADLFLEMVEGGVSERPGLIVHVSAETLLEGLPGVAETANGTVLTPDEIRRIACDANLSRVVFGPDSRPLDVGRSRRLVTPAQRVAVMARDLHCVFPACDRLDRWCDVHHIVSWIDDGPTDIDNLVLLCRHHHRLIHEVGWRIEGRPGNLHFHRPDGTELGAEPPPRPVHRSPVVEHQPPPRDDFDFRSIIDQVRAIPYPRGP